MRDGSIRGGIPFRRGAFYHLLANRIYLGQIVHKDTTYPGEHEAVLKLTASKGFVWDVELWLDGARVGHGPRLRALTGVLAAL